ncbi:MAG: hypothetical protein HFH26_14205 [Clostridiaceae bacterium]|nr:hypothetical protein [Clostridiaceae bacterium]
MLEQVLTHLKNWFIVPGGVHSGTFTVEDGGISLPFLREGQYFRILGSVWNDGLYQYGPAMEALTDETFDGAVWALAVPRAVIDLSAEISAWQTKYGERVSSPYTSESFAGYSYTKPGGSDGSTGGWQTAFRLRLNPYRKLREIQ